ncbi:MAG: hypothetical protein JO255_18240, partial [Alphaproteobacteria bacterium]|nr:hypothetical protein [Alphaproteobacteria bacterium]
LAMNANGSIFGTASAGGFGLGTILYELDQPYGYGTLKLAHAFAITSGSGGVASDGLLANGDLATDENGNVFGTTFSGGANGRGIIYLFKP